MRGVPTRLASAIATAVVLLLLSGVVAVKAIWTVFAASVGALVVFAGLLVMLSSVKCIL